MSVTNLFAGLANDLPDEVVTTLLEAGTLRIERIVSQGQTSPDGFWYDQEQHEWVVLVAGAARLRFEKKTVELRPGDFVNIPAHTKHRVEWTTPDQPTVWLAVFYGRERARSAKSQEEVEVIRTDRACIAMIGGAPVDLNSGMIEAVTNPPHGFTSKRSFPEMDMASRLAAIDWFAHCGEAMTADLSMETERILDWPSAIAASKEPAWEDAKIEAQNQLTLWLHLHDRANYRKWNEITRAHKGSLVDPLMEEKIRAFQTDHQLDIKFAHSVRWDILAALMENSYLSSGHRSFFYSELFLVYETGHFPCGWIGEWPQGKLRVF